MADAGGDVRGPCGPARREHIVIHSRVEVTYPPTGGARNRDRRGNVTAYARIIEVKLGKEIDNDRKDYARRNRESCNRLRIV